LDIVSESGSEKFVAIFLAFSHFLDSNQITKTCLNSNHFEECAVVKTTQSCEKFILEIGSGTRYFFIFSKIFKISQIQIFGFFCHSSFMKLKKVVNNLIK
jgi:hypothetical protein